VITTTTYGMDDGFTEFIAGIGIETGGEEGSELEFVGGSDGTG
jgi:hypothetical protein